MSKFLLLTFLLLAGFSAMSQQTCTNNLDSLGAMNIAKKEKALWTKDPNRMPWASFDAQTCTWIVQSLKYSYTRKGKCKYTNGCTITRVLTVEIDATTKKVRSKKKEKHMTHNYE